MPSLAGYATQQWTADYMATNGPPPVDLAPYATRAYADAAASNAQAAAEAAIPSLAGYATEQWTADYFSTNYTPPDLSSYASRSYADAAASNAQAAAIAAIPSLAGYATEQWTADYFATNYTPPDLSSYASRSYADAVASNAQAAAIAAIPSLAGFATETYAQNAASDAASDALSAAQSYARDLSWAASQGNTRLVSIDGTIWQDATGTVWKVSNVYGWRGTALDLATTTARPVLFAPVPGSNDVWSAGVGTNLVYDVNGMQSYCIIIAGVYYYEDDYAPQSATNLTITTEYDKYYLYYSVVALATNPVDHVLYEQSPVLRDIIAEQATGTVNRALSIGTPSRWADATGCVWEVGYRYDDDWVADSSRVTQVSWSSAGYEDDPDLWAIYFTVDGSIKAQIYNFPPGPTQTNLTIYASDWIAQYDGAFDFNIYRSPHTTTNLVGRVALTNDIASATDEVLQSALRADAQSLSDFAATGTVHAAESSTYSSRLFDASFDAAYDATYLIRESTNAATAVSSSLVRYSLVTPGVWNFSGSGVQGGEYIDEWYNAGTQEWAYQVRRGDVGVSLPIHFSTSQTTLNFSDVGILANLIPSGTILDRSVNSLSITSITNITLPALSHPGQARDFILLLDIPASITNTVPAITNLLTFTASGAETVHYYVDGDDPSATFPLPTSPGTWSYSFSEFKAGWFAVSLKPIVEAAAPGGAQ